MRRCACRTPYLQRRQLAAPAAAERDERLARLRLRRRREGREALDLHAAHTQAQPRGRSIVHPTHIAQPRGRSIVHPTHAGAAAWVGHRTHHGTHWEGGGRRVGGARLPTAARALHEHAIRQQSATHEGVWGCGARLPTASRAAAAHFISMQSANEGVCVALGSRRPRAPRRPTAGAGGAVRRNECQRGARQDRASVARAW